VGRGLRSIAIVVGTVLPIAIVVILAFDPRGGSVGLAPPRVKPLSARDAMLLQRREALSQRQAEQKYNSDESAWRLATRYAKHEAAAQEQIRRCPGLPVESEQIFERNARAFPQTFNKTYCSKEQDMQAIEKANERVSLVESCVVWTGDYRQCTNPCRSQRWLRLPRPRSRFGSVLELQTLRSIRNALARDRSGWGCGGEVSVAAPNATSVTVTSVSAANTGGENHRFLITEVGVGGSKERTCSPKGEGLCHSDGTWG